MAITIEGVVYRNIQEQVQENKEDIAELQEILADASITDGTNTVTIADLAALVAYAKAQGWIS